MRKFWLTLISIACAGEAFAVTSAAKQVKIIEVEPLQGAVGQLGARAETVMNGKFALGGAYESTSRASERHDFTDRFSAAQIEGIFYPRGLNDYPIFLGAGIRYESAEIGRERPRDATTWARTHADETNDLWTNHDTYLSLAESIGYRFLASQLFTASLRLSRDELFWQTSSVAAEDVRSEGIDLKSRGREKVKERVVLNMGVWLP